ncbi:hypothetical protein E2C01_087517 [Portunus trituberculatus]|uniref:Uncharacterized protein n=1 Tax=Portunus trituberculatus TaxID=210409 RepID=A0A5B7JHH9_PORTR|nr:hypothetical protein [Portunus trituberculatus]
MRSVISVAVSGVSGVTGVYFGRTGPRHKAGGAWGVLWGRRVRGDFNLQGDGVTGVTLGCFSHPGVPEGGPAGDGGCHVPWEPRVRPHHALGVRERDEWGEGGVKEGEIEFVG